MKQRAKLLGQIIIACCMTLCYHHDGFSQGTDLSSRNKNSLYIGFNINPTKTSIINSGLLRISELSSTKMNSLSGTVEAGYFFSKVFGLSTGIGFSSYKSDLALNSYTDSYDTIDSDIPYEAYTRSISGNNIHEIQQISYLNIPLIANFRITVSEIFGFYLQTGFNVSVPVKKHYTSSGRFTYEGFYPAYNIRITGVPFEGFEKNYNNSSEGELKVNSFNTELIASTGVSFTLQKKIQVSIGILYSKMLTDLSGYSSSPSYRLTSVPDQMRSTMEGSSKASASAMGLKFGVRYYLK